MKYDEKKKIQISTLKLKVKFYRLFFKNYTVQRKHLQRRTLIPMNTRT